MRKSFIRAGAMALLFAPAAAQAAPGDRGAAVIAVPAHALRSPGGDRAVWLNEERNGLWLVERDAQNGGWSAPRIAFTIRGGVRNPVFSPDGMAVAFENPRGGHVTGGYVSARQTEWSYIATFDFGSRCIAYLEPAFARDLDPRWSADGRQISFTRKAAGRAEARLTIARPGAEPPASTPARYPGSFAIEAVLGAPLVYQPQASGDGRSIAYVAREGRKRAIYFKRLGEPARAVAVYPDDDGQELSDVALSRDGRMLVYVRGGPVNNKGEVPNPRSTTQAPSRQIWRVRTDGGASPELLGTGEDPQISPDDTRIVWSAERGLVSTPLTGALGTGELLLSGTVANPRFSPDGRRLVFERAGHIELFDLTTLDRRTVTKPADAVDAGPVWSPDGANIAFRRMLGKQPTFLGIGYEGPYVSAEPWSIWSAGGDTGGEDPAPRRLWQAQPGMGSAFYGLTQDATNTGVRADQLFWSRSGRIGFVWERDGWRHLYAIPERGGDAVLLTAGDGEVESAALSHDGRSLVYSHNIGDLDRRHLASVALDGGAPLQLTTGNASQWGATPLSDGRLAYIHAGWADPPRVTIRDGDGRSAAEALPAIPADYPARAMVEPQAVSFPGTDGETAYGQLFVPRKPRGCGVVYVHGGIRRQMLLGYHYIDAYSNLYEMNQYFADRGCAVLSVEYRSSIMRGHAFRNAPGWGDAGASEYKDVLGGANYLKSRADLKVGRIGIYGLSWGGYLTAQALARNSDVFAVGFDMAGVHDFLKGGYPHSPMAHAGKWTSPVYIAAGDDDRNVDFNQSMVLADLLRAKRPDVKMVERVIPNETHDMYLTFNTLTDLYREGGEFMLDELIGTKGKN